MHLAATLAAIAGPACAPWEAYVQIPADILDVQLARARHEHLRLRNNLGFARDPNLDLGSRRAIAPDVKAK